MIHFLIFRLKIINIIPNLKDREIPEFLTGKWDFVCLLSIIIYKNHKYNVNINISFQISSKFSNYKNIW